MSSDRWQPRRNADGDREGASTSRSTAVELDRQGESSRSRYSPRADREDDRSERPNKTRRIDDRDAPRSATAVREGDKPPALTIRGVAASHVAASPPRANEDRPRRARSPDLFDRLDRRQDDANGSSRSRQDSSLRSRLDDRRVRADVSDAPRRGGAKLAPLGRYDDNGRRIDDSPPADSRDRTRVARARDDIPTPPRRRDPPSRRHRERSDSPDLDRTRYRVDERDGRFQDGRSTRHDRNRTSRRSPSPTTVGTPRRQTDRYDRYEPHRSPPASRSRHDADDRDASASGPRRVREWGAKARDGDQDLSVQDDDRTSSRRRRSPSPARSDASNRSRRRDRDTERVAEPDRQRDRPARWRLDNSNDPGSDATRFRRDGDGAQRRDQRQTERRRSPDTRGARTPPRDGRAGDTLDRGHVLSRKSGLNATQPPTGPRRQDAEANERSVRGGGWQTVRPGARRERDAARAVDASGSARNGHAQAESGGKGTKRPQTPPVEAPAAPIEPPRAEPGEAYESIHQVGEGTYGQVFKARSERTGALVALKKIRMDSEKDGFPVTAMREIKLLQALRHENVVRLHEMMVTRGSIYMVFEYMEHDLNGILAHPQVQFSRGHLKSLAQQLFSGLDYLHRKAVLHRDLKGSNILLNNQGRLKLADFGLARFYAKRRLGDYTNRVVTLWYRPPELLFGETQYGSEVDMWGAGCIFLELFVKKPVFQSETELGQVQAITDILGPVTKESWPEVDKLAWYEMVKPATIGEDADAEKDYVAAAFSKYLPEPALEVARGLLTYDPRKRWSAKEALASRYFEQEPRAELPAGLLSALEGEWHEYESRRAKKKATGQRGTDNATVATAGSTDTVVARVAVDDQQPAAS